MISYRRVEKESDELLYTVWPLVMVRYQLPAQAVKINQKVQGILQVFLLLAILLTRLR